MRHSRERTPKAGDIKKRRATLRDVASLAGVDYSTVSRVLRGTRDAATRPETRERIKKAAKELNYHPNRLARALRTARANYVGVVVTDLANPTNREMIYSIEKVAGAVGVTTVIYHVDDKHRPSHTLWQIAADSHVDGLIIAARLVIEGEFGSVDDLPCAVVVVNETEIIDDFVALDHAEGARLATQHLIDLGHRNISLLPGEPGMLNARRRIEGYKKSIQAAKLREDIAICSGYGPDETFDAISTLFEGGKGPTAVLTATLPMAMASLAALRERGLQVPRDISLISLQNDPSADLVDPAISSVDFPVRDLGNTAAQALLEKINGAPTKLPRFLAPIGFIERASVAGPGKPLQ